MSDTKELNKLQGFLSDLLDLVEEKGYEDYVLMGCSTVLAVSAVESGIDTTENDVELFTGVSLKGEPALANIRITTDMVSLTDRYVANGIINPVHGQFYVCSKSNVITPDMSNTEGDLQLH